MVRVVQKPSVVALLTVVLRTDTCIRTHVCCLVCCCLPGLLLQVLGYLKEATLAGKASTPEAHMSALQSTVNVSQQKIKETLEILQKQLHGKAGKGAEAKGSEGFEAATVNSIGELLKSQFGPVAVSERVPAGWAAVHWMCDEERSVQQVRQSVVQPAGCCPECTPGCLMLCIDQQCASHCCVLLRCC